MSKMKKVFTLFFVPALLFALTACGGGGQENGNAAEDGASGGSYKIGVIYPMSGGNALFGNAMVDATRIAVDMINEAGGDRKSVV